MVTVCGVYMRHIPGLATLVATFGNHDYEVCNVDGQTIVWCPGLAIATTHGGLAGSVVTTIAISKNDAITRLTGNGPIILPTDENSPECNHQAPL